jgi:hypothetical protein
MANQTTYTTIANGDTLSQGYYNEIGGFYNEITDSGTAGVDYVMTGGGGAGLKQRITFAFSSITSTYILKAISVKNFKIKTSNATYAAGHSFEFSDGSESYTIPPTALSGAESLTTVYLGTCVPNSPMTLGKTATAFSTGSNYYFLLPDITGKTSANFYVRAWQAQAGQTATLAKGFKVRLIFERSETSKASGTTSNSMY